MKCPNCGFENIPGTVQCLNCKLDIAGKEVLVSSDKKDKPKRPFISPKFAWVFSLIPGLGQFLAGRYTKGLSIFIFWLVLISYYLYSFNSFVFTMLFLLHTYSILECIFTGIYWERNTGILIAIFVILLMIGFAHIFHYLINLRIEPVIVPGNHWAPTLKSGDAVLFNKLAYKNEKPKRGDIVLYKPATGYIGGTLVRGDGRSLEKIIGLPGESVKIIEWEILINGNELPKEFYPLASNFLPKNYEETIPEGSYLLMQIYRPEQYSRLSSITELSILGRMIRSYHPFP